MKHPFTQNSIACSLLLTLVLIQLVLPQTSNPSSNLLAVPITPSGTTALSNLTLIDGRGGPPLLNRTLVISNGRIVDIFKTGSKSLPSGAKVEDLTGKFVMPGMIDSHVHLMTRERPPETVNALLRFALLGGVTSVRDMGGNGAKLAALKTEQTNGRIVSPRIYYSAVMSGKDSRWFDGSYLSFASNGMPLGDAPWARAVTPEMDVAKVIADAKSTGASAIKLYSHLSADTMAKLSAEAHRQNLKVWSHPMRTSDIIRSKPDSVSHAGAMVGEGHEDSIDEAADWRQAMMDGLRNAPVDSPKVTNLLRTMASDKVVLDATLYVFAMGAANRESQNLEWSRKLYEFGSALTRRAKQLGVTVAAGTDAMGGSSPNLHAELQLLVKDSRFTPLEAITAATLGSAKAIGIENDLGTLEKGKIADLLILNEDPARDIRNTQTIEAVMQEGKLFRRDRPVPTPPLAEAPVSTRIKNVENGLIPPVIKTGKQNEMTLADRMRHYKVPAVSIAVVDNGRIEWAKAYGETEAGSGIPVTTETLFQAGSISKPVATIAALDLVEDKKLELDTDVNLALKSWKVTDNEFTKDKKVTIRGLVTHSAGLTVHGFDGYASNTTPPTVTQVLDGNKPANSPAIRVDYIPGTRERYSGGGFTVLQQLMTDVTGKGFVELTNSRIFRKLGMSQTTFASPLPALAANAASGHQGDGKLLPGKYHTYPEMAAASLWSTPTDLAKLAIELQRSYAGESSRILSPQTTRSMMTRQLSSLPNSDVGLGFFLKGRPEPFRFSHNGSTEGYCAIMAGFLKNGKAAVIMTNSDDDGELISEIMRSIAKEYSWDDMKPDEVKVVDVDPKLFGKYVGKYRLVSGMELTVTSDNGKIFAALAGRSPIEIVPESETKFALIMPTAPRINFVADNLGEFAEIVFIRAGREEKGLRVR